LEAEKNDFFSWKKEGGRSSVGRGRRYEISHCLEKVNVIWKAKLQFFYWLYGFPAKKSLTTYKHASFNRWL
jgi:hypothetical protein